MYHQYGTGNPQQQYQQQQQQQQPQQPLQRIPSVMINSGNLSVHSMSQQMQSSNGRISNLSVNNNNNNSGVSMGQWPCICCKQLLSVPTNISCFKCTICNTVTDLASIYVVPANIPPFPPALSLDYIKIAYNHLEHSNGKEEIKRDLDNIVTAAFSNRNTLNSSFSNNQPISLTNNGVNLEQVREAYSIMFSKGGRRMEQLILRAVDSLLKRPGIDIMAPNQVQYLLILWELPLFKEQARIIQSSSMELSTTHEILSRLYGIISSLNNKVHHYLVSWLKEVPLNVLERRINMVNMFISFRLTNREGMMNNYFVDWGIRCAARMMALLFAANNQRIPLIPGGSSVLFSRNAVTAAEVAMSTEAANKLPLSTFYNTVVDYANLYKDFHVWQTINQNNMLAFSFCQYPFLISLGGKISIVEYDAKRQMAEMFKKAYINAIKSSMQQEPQHNHDSPLSAGAEVELTSPQINTLPIVSLSVDSNAETSSNSSNHLSESANIPSSSIVNTDNSLKNSKIIEDSKSKQESIVLESDSSKPKSHGYGLSKLAKIRLPKNSKRKIKRRSTSPSLPKKDKLVFNNNDDAVVSEIKDITLKDTDKNNIALDNDDNRIVQEIEDLSLAEDIAGSNIINGNSDFTSNIIDTNDLISPNNINGVQNTKLTINTIESSSSSVNDNLNNNDAENELKSLQDSISPISAQALEFPPDIPQLRNMGSFDSLNEVSAINSVNNINNNTNNGLNILENNIPDASINYSDNANTNVQNINIPTISRINSGLGHRRVVSSSATVPSNLQLQPEDLFLTLNVRRHNIIEDSLIQLRVRHNELKKKLRITFVDEAGIDAGGLTKEWFLLLIRDLFDPQYGMFAFDDRSNLCWFNPASLENSDVFRLVGQVIGLAIYNSTILDIHFPLACYKKLLNYPVGLDDLAQLKPDVVDGINKMLEYKNEDFENVFSLNFVIQYEAFGEIKEYELVPHGNFIPVTKDNVDEYVEKIVDWHLNKSVERQFESFKAGFYYVCGSNSLSLFRPEEIEVTVTGSPELDFTELEGVCKYKGFDPEKDEIIKQFWSIIHDWKPEMKKKLLEFVTGSDCIPPTGIQNMILYISNLGEDCNRLPIAHTCFNELGLYNYTTKEKLQEKLETAVLCSSGFFIR